ncbi:MAG: hypothetical protein WC695_01215 [Candidatus Omnitrophota bacterium]
MGNLKKYLLIAVALAAFFILSAINRSGGTAPCCPFSAIRTTGTGK